MLSGCCYLIRYKPYLKLLLLVWWVTEARGFGSTTPTTSSRTDTIAGVDGLSIANRVRVRQSTCRNKRRQEAITVLRGGVLSHSDIIRASKRNRKKRRRGHHTDHNKYHHSRHEASLSEVIAEALARQERIRQNLERERERSTGISADEKKGDEKILVKNQRRKLIVQQKLKELQSTIHRLQEFRREISSFDRDDGKGKNSPEERIRQGLKDLGFESLLVSSDSLTEKWLTVQELENEFGRPNGFTGLVFHSPNHVPILIGKMGAHADETLRRISQGSDLWFQVENYEGSRVLLRTSLCRGYRDSKACMQMAADLAAYYSTSRWRKYDDDGETIHGFTAGSNSSSSSSNANHNQQQQQHTVNVMYTDSKHVAKRGSKVGRLRKKKSLGRIVARPGAVLEIAKGKEP